MGWIIFISNLAPSLLFPTQTRIELCIFNSFFPVRIHVVLWVITFGFDWNRETNLLLNISNDGDNRKGKKLWGNSNWRSERLFSCVIGIVCRPYFPRTIILSPLPKSFLPLSLWSEKKRDSPSFLLNGLLMSIIFSSFSMIEWRTIWKKSNTLEPKRNAKGKMRAPSRRRKFFFFFFSFFQWNRKTTGPAQPSVFVFVCARTDQTRIRYGGISFPVERGGKNWIEWGMAFCRSLLEKKPHRAHKHLDQFREGGNIKRKYDVSV